MISKRSVLFAVLTCAVLLVSCSQEENNTAVTTGDTDEILDTAYDTTRINNDTTTVETPPTQSNNQTVDDSAESNITIHPTPSLPTENAAENPTYKIFINPDGTEFAYELQAHYNDFKEPIVQYWDTGEILATFELHPDSGNGKIFKINGHVINCLYVSTIRQILVENEYIVVIYSLMEPNRYPIYIYDHDGNILFKTYYLSNTGMVTSGAVTVTDNKIKINGSRWTHGPSITLGINSSRWDDFLEYSDYLYEDAVYDYGDNFSLPYEVYLDDSNAEQIKILNPNEKTDAVFEMEYLGWGKFSKLNMVSCRTLGDFYSYWD